MSTRSNHQECNRFERDLASVLDHLDPLAPQSDHEGLAPEAAATRELRLQLQSEDPLAPPSDLEGLSPEAARDLEERMAATRELHSQSERMAIEMMFVASTDSEASKAELAAHLQTCATCLARRATYQRLLLAMRDVEVGAQRRPDHVARALAAARSQAASAPSMPTWRRPLRVAAPLLAVAAAVALGLWLRRDPPPAPPRFSVVVVAQGKTVLRGDAQLGELLRVTARAGAAIWIYRDDRALLLSCPRECRRQGDQLIGELVLDTIGRYQIVWLSTDRVPSPTGNLERDVAAARGVGAAHELRDLEVQ